MDDLCEPYYDDGQADHDYYDYDRFEFEMSQRILKECEDDRAN